VTAPAPPPSKTSVSANALRSEVRQSVLLLAVFVGVCGLPIALDRLLTGLG